MSIAQVKAARRKMKQRYGNASSHRSVADSIARERAKAAREQAAKKK